MRLFYQTSDVAIFFKAIPKHGLCFIAFSLCVYGGLSSALLRLVSLKAPKTKFDKD